MRQWEWTSIVLTRLPRDLDGQARRGLLGTRRVEETAAAEGDTRAGGS